MSKLPAALFFMTLACAKADTLTLRNGAVVTGTWMGLGSDQISFMVDGKTRTYPRADVSKVTFGPVPAVPEVKSGMNVDEVVAILGKPESVSGSGASQVYSYKNLKVTFVDGRVTDVQ